VVKQFHLVAEEVCKFTNTTFFDIMDRPAMEVLGIVILIKAKTEINRQ
jgi:hypothetical protein